MEKLTLVVGASENPERYSNKAILSLRKHNFPVKAIGLRAGKVMDVEIEKGCPPISDIHTVTMYVNPKNQANLIDYLLMLRPKRVVFNPGSENPEFEKKLAYVGIEYIEACTLVMLATGASRIDQVLWTPIQE